MERVVVYPVSDRETIKKIKHRGEGSYWSYSQKFVFAHEEYNVNEMEAMLKQAFAEREAKEYVDRMKVRQAEMDRELQRMKSGYNRKRV